MTAKVETSQEGAASQPHEAMRLWMGRLAFAGLVVHALFLSISVAGMQIGLGVTLAALIVLRLSGRRVLKRSSLDLPLILFVGTAIVSLAVAWIMGRPPAGWHMATLWRSILTPILILSGLYAAQQESELPPPRKRALLLLVVWSAAAIVPSAIAWIQHYTGLDPFHLFGWRQTPVQPRAPYDPTYFAAVGFFRWYQRLAHSLIPPLCLVAGVVVYGGLARRLRVFLSVVIIAAVTAVVLTTSRLAWVSLAAAGVLLAVLGGVRVMRWALPAVVAGTIAVALVLPGVSARLLNVTALRDNGDRATIWKVCTAAIRDNPAVGMGWGNFTKYSGPYWSKIAPEYPLKAWCHNSFLSAWAEGGALFAIVVGLYWLLLALSLWRWRLEGDALARGASAGALAGLCAMFLNSLGHDIFYSSEATYSIGFMLGVAAGLAWVDAAVKNGRAERERGNSKNAVT